MKVRISNDLLEWLNADPLAPFAFGIAYLLMSKPLCRTGLVALGLEVIVRTSNILW
jgi:hypothetical protein